MKLKKAKPTQIDKIWEIIQDAIKRRKEDGSSQWQNGYPNLKTIGDDINDKSGYVLIKNSKVVAYVSIKINDELAYEKIEGKWLTNSDFLVLHRMAVDKNYLGKGIATNVFKLVEDIAKENQICSIKVDTNFDNEPMLQIFKKLGYQYCGKVFFGTSERMAFEKVLAKERLKQPNIKDE